jgi:Zn finger protein HypA/HybF involved in hydrogenase expression
LGDIYKISSDCGYSKDLFLGAGLASINIKTVNRVFSAEKRKDFDNHFNKGEVQSFTIMNEACYCDKCEDIMAIAVLKVQLTDNSEFDIINDCPNCGNKIQIQNNVYICPKCNKEMTIKKVGHWD